eukprot:scaffold33779_cov50-Prasinocladus_malaysianus.AAC.4
MPFRRRAQSFQLHAMIAESGSMAVESHPQYWAAVHKAVALGWMGMAEDLLSWHSAWRRSQTPGEGWEPEVGALEVRLWLPTDDEERNELQIKTYKSENGFDYFEFWL